MLNTSNAAVNTWSNGFSPYATHADGRVAYIRIYRNPGWEPYRTSVFQTKLSTDTTPIAQDRHPRTVGVTKAKGWTILNEQAAR